MCRGARGGHARPARRDGRGKSARLKSSAILKNSASNFLTKKRRSRYGFIKMNGSASRGGSVTARSQNAYVTYAPEYIETIWWTLAQIWKRKLLYQGHRIVQWCTRCGTSLSSHELAQGYQEVIDNSVYVKFKLRKGSGSAILWRTMPRI